MTCVPRRHKKRKRIIHGYLVISYLFSSLLPSVPIPLSRFVSCLASLEVKHEPWVTAITSWEGWVWWARRMTCFTYYNPGCVILIYRANTHVYPFVQYDGWHQGGWSRIASGGRMESCLCVWAAGCEGEREDNNSLNSEQVLLSVRCYGYDRWGLLKIYYCLGKKYLRSAWPIYC